MSSLESIHPSRPPRNKTRPSAPQAPEPVSLALPSNITMSTATTSSTNSATKPSSSAANSYHHHHHQHQQQQLPTTQACAACKYQRRKCIPDCPLAPYFPADQHRQFLNAHRLFGVSNILKIIRGLDAQRRTEAMRSIIFQSNARAHDPVGGCYRIILELQRQIEHFSAELSLVLRQIELYRSQAAAEAANSSIPPDLLLTPAEDVVVDPASYPAHFPAAPDVQQQQTQPQMQYYNYFYFDGGGRGDDNENNHNQQTDDNENDNQNHVLDLDVVPESMFAMQPPQQRCEEEDLKPLVDMFEIRQAFATDDQEVDSKDAASFHSSSKTEQKEEQNRTENVQEHDLKGAASLFTLTNCNTSSV